MPCPRWRAGPALAGPGGGGQDIRESRTPRVAPGGLSGSRLQRAAGMRVFFL